MWWFIVTFVVGLAVGKLQWLPTALLHHSHRISMPCLIALVLLLGYQVGSNRSLMHQLPQIGWQAIVIAIFSIIGSALCAWLTWSFFFTHNHRVHESVRSKEADS
jgi:uncharacterized membrane protein YbjE (DUF340 family)